MRDTLPGFQPNVPRNSPVLLTFLKKRLEQTTASPAGDLSEEAPLQESPARGLAALPRDAKQSVVVVYVLAFLNMAMMTTITPMLLLYLQHNGLVSEGSTQFYVTVSVRSEERRGGEEGRSRWAPDH